MSLQHMLRAAAGAKVLLEYTHTAESVSNGSTYTFNSVNIGTATADRLVVVVATGSVGGTNRTITGVTIDGTGGATVVSQAAGVGLTNQPKGFIAQRLVTSGTSITVVVSCSSTFTRMAIAVYTLKDYDSSTAIDTDQTLYSGATGTATATLDMQAGGAAIFAAQTNENRTSSWSSAIENVDAQYSGETSTYTMASIFPTITVTAHSETVTWTTGSDATSTIVAASWR